MPSSYLLAMSLLVCTPGVAQTPAENAEIRAAAQAFDDAQLHGDRAVLERMLAPDYLLVRGSGRIGGKADFIAGFTDPKSHLEPFEIGDRLFLRPSPDTAIVGGEARVHGTEDGKPFAEHFRYSDIFAAQRTVDRGLHAGDATPDAMSGAWVKTLGDALAPLPMPATAKWPQGEPYQCLLNQPGAQILIFAPRETDRQTPHNRDETYVAARGTAILEIEGKPHPLAVGDIAWVPKDVPHRFAAISDDFAVWVMFFG